MICHPCRDRHHEDCPGGNWCDCQHKPADDTRGGQESAEDAR